LAAVNAPTRSRLAPLAAALCLTALSGCAGADQSPPDRAAVSSTPSPAAATSPATAAPSVSPTSAPKPSPTPVAQNVFTIRYADGKVSGDTGRLRVGLGETVSITVTSLRADELHLHGYDLLVPLPAGRPAELRFRATIPGVFELELEELHRQLATLQGG